MSYSIYSSAEYSSFQLSFQICPIFLYNGIAQNLPGQMLPILQITQLYNPNPIISIDDYLCHYQPISGGKLISFEIAEYPFANQTVAANAIIANPLKITLKMTAPAKSTGDYVSKITTFTSLQNSLYQHSLLGGTYCVVTPAYLYNNVLLSDLTDITPADSKQVQSIWQWDFTQPLITQQQAAAAQSGLMQKITNGSLITGQPSTSGPNVSASPSGATGTGEASSAAGSQITAPTVTSNNPISPTQIQPLQ